MVVLVLLWLLKSEHGISPEMKEQFSYRIGVTSRSTEHVHRRWQYKLTAVIYFLSPEKKKVIKWAKNFAQNTPPLQQHQPRSLERHRGNIPGNHSFSPRDPTHCPSSPRKRRELRVRGEKGACPHHLIYSWAVLNSNDKNNKSCGSNVTNSCADVQMGNLQTNCPRTIRCADRLSQHWLCVLFVRGGCLVRGGWNAFWADNGLAQVCNYFGGKLSRPPRVAKVCSACVQLPCRARKIQGPCAGQNSFALLPLPAWKDAENISSIWASGDFSHLTNIICSITKQQYFGT